MASLRARTQAVDSRVKAFNSRDEASVLALARASDERRVQGQKSRDPSTAFRSASRT